MAEALQWQTEKFLAESGDKLPGRVPRPDQRGAGRPAQRARRHRHREDQVGAREAGPGLAAGRLAALLQQQQGEQAGRRRGGPRHRGAAGPGTGAAGRQRRRSGRRRRRRDRRRGRQEVTRRATRPSREDEVGMTEKPRAADPAAAGSAPGGTERDRADGTGRGADRHPGQATRSTTTGGKPQGPTPTRSRRSRPRSLVPRTPRSWIDEIEPVDPPAAGRRSGPPVEDAGRRSRRTAAAPAPAGSAPSWSRSGPSWTSAPATCSGSRPSTPTTASGSTATGALVAGADHRPGARRAAADPRRPRPGPGARRPGRAVRQRWPSSSAPRWASSG